MTNEFTVIGENRDNETELLVVGTDGHYYEYNLVLGDVFRTEPDDHQWKVFPRGEEEEPSELPPPGHDDPHTG